MKKKNKMIVRRPEKFMGYIPTGSKLTASYDDKGVLVVKLKK